MDNTQVWNEESRVNCFWEVTEHKGPSSKSNRRNQIIESVRDSEFALLSATKFEKVPLANRQARTMLLATAS